MIRTGLLGRWSVALLALALGASAARGSDEVRESWDAVYIRGQRVGYFRTAVEPVKDRDKSLVRVRVEMTLSFKRGKDPVTMEMLYGTIETPDGSVLRLDTRIMASRNEMRSHGDVIDGKMKLVLEGSGQHQEATIPWEADVRGPYGAELSLSRQPMKPGESREVKIFLPEVNRVCLAKMEAKRVEPVQLGGGVKMDLLRVEQEVFLDGKPMPGTSQVHWVDPNGQILRNTVDVFGGMETYRTTREAALRNVTRGQFDLTEASLVKVTRKLNNPYASREVVYNLIMKGDEPGKNFPNDRRQTITPESDPTRARLVVRSAGPDDGEPSPESQAVGPEYSRPNAMIESQDPRVVALAQKATAGLADPWQKAQAIEHWVFENIQKKNFETSFAPASEVARDLTGDCTEHSVLTAAMCRAVGIPCRVVVGLIYDDPHQAFGFHMWDEVYVNRRWVAIDAAFDQAQVDAVHLKLNDSSMDGVAPFETFLAVVRLFNKLTVEPVEVR